MELDGRFSNKLLVGGIFAVLIFGLVDSQQAMADENGAPPPPLDIEIDKCASTSKSDLTGFEKCDVAEGSASSILIVANEGETVFFRIDVTADPTFPDVTGIVVNDLLPDGIISVSFEKDITGPTNGYDPATGIWDVGTIDEGSTRSLLITTIVGTGTCGTTLVNTATLTAVDQTESPTDNNEDSVSVQVVPASGDCPPIVTSPGNVFVVMGNNFNNLLDDGSLAIANLVTGELTQTGPAIFPLISFDFMQDDGGLSGLAIDSTGRFFVTAGVAEGSGASLLIEVDGGTGGIIDEIGETLESGTERVKVRDLAFQPGTDILFGVGNVDVVEGSSNANALFTIDLEDAEVDVITSLVGPRVKGIAFDPNDGKLWAVNEDDGCALTTINLETGVQTTVTPTDRCYDGLGIDADGQIFATTKGTGFSLHLIDPSDGSDVTAAGVGENPSDVDFIAFVETSSSSGSGGGHESPTIGKNMAGIQIVNSKGICIDPLKPTGQCWTVTEFDTGFKLLPLLSSSHTITNTIFCNEGVQECDFVGVSFMTSTDLFGELVMMVEAQKTGGEWTISWYDPQDFIHDPDDYPVGDPRGAITFTVQIVDGTGILSQDGNFLLTSFTIDFKNKNTGELVIRIQVGDEEHGQSTFWFNEGVEIIDSDAYPSIVTEFEESLEIDSLCLNEDPTYRNSCAFAENRDLATQLAEDTLGQMLNGEYIYK